MKQPLYEPVPFTVPVNRQSSMVRLPAFMHPTSPEASTHPVRVPVMSTSPHTFSSLDVPQESDTILVGWNPAELNEPFT